MTGRKNITINIKHVLEPSVHLLVFRGKEKTIPTLKSFPKLANSGMDERSFS
jgi:hypothetical protein